ncbi:MAG: hypothetical protein COB67_10700 [SAR324 cluster bacterium]|uniref:DUF4381 domain-containing protein n=1 Tax=SAR324 cluster bacterium TaxID=2024889 RepID=A0A2A4SVQ2_9DELT|nr:MAG: hypothetical protein COB67_10700 [SAR324 cluster bacterium]
MKPFSFYLALVGSLFFFGCDSSQQASESLKDPSYQVEKVATLGGAPIQVKVRLSQAKIPLTDYLRLQIFVEAEAGIVLTAPYLSEDVYSPLLLVEKPKSNDGWLKDQATLFYQWDYKLEPLNSGEFQIKPFQVHFRLEKEKPTAEAPWPVYTITTEAIKYQVDPVSLTTIEEIRPLRGPILPLFNYWPFLLTLLALVSLGLLFFLLLRYQNRSQAHVTRVEESRNYHLEALQALDKLEKEDLISQDQFELLHIRLSTILRQYVEQYFSIPAQEQTTEEFIQDISHLTLFSPAQKHQLQQFLKLVDLVKFASFAPGSQNSIEAMSSIRSFIQTTGKTDGI